MSATALLTKLRKSIDIVEIEVLTEVVTKRHNAV
jgi:hypothetical protein